MRPPRFFTIFPRSSRREIQDYIKCIYIQKQPTHKSFTSSSPSPLFAPLYAFILTYFVFSYISIMFIYIHLHPVWLYNISLWLSSSTRESSKTSSGNSRKSGSHRKTFFLPISSFHLYLLKRKRYCIHGVPMYILL